MKKIVLSFFILNALLALIGCGGHSTAHLQVVQNFDAQNYMGKWYEIARFDHSFEQGMTHVYTQYTRLDSGKIKVKNVGFRAGVMHEADAIGHFNDASNVGALKVCFFFPFYSAYNIIFLDAHKQYAIVTSSTYNYLWILSRTPKIEKSTLNNLVEIAKSYGFETENLIYVNQEEEKDK